MTKTQNIAGDLGAYAAYRESVNRVPACLRSRLPPPVRRLLIGLYWCQCDAVEFLIEVVGHLPSHTLRLFLYRHMAKVSIGHHTSIHRGCRFYWPAGVCLGDHTVINRDVLLDGRMGLSIADNVSISEGVAIFTLEHDPGSSTFASRGGPVIIEDYAFLGARAIILPGNTIGQGAFVAAGAVVTHNVEPYTIVGGVPARPIATRCQDLTYKLDYRKFLG